MTSSTGVFVIFSLTFFLLTTTPFLNVSSYTTSFSPSLPCCFVFLSPCFNVGSFSSFVVCFIVSLTVLLFVISGFLGSTLVPTKIISSIGFFVIFSLTFFLLTTTPFLNVSSYTTSFSPSLPCCFVFLSPCFNVGSFSSFVAYWIISFALTFFVSVFALSKSFSKMLSSIELLPPITIKSLFFEISLTIGEKSTLGDKTTALFSFLASGPATKLSAKFSPLTTIYLLSEISLANFSDVSYLLEPLILCTLAYFDNSFSTPLVIDFSPPTI